MAAELRIRIDGLEYTITDALVSLSFANGQNVQEILRPRSPDLVVHLTGTGKMPVPAYLLLGIEHILTGFDHLSFVLGLLLLVRSRRTLIKTITAFTVADSLTPTMRSAVTATVIRTAGRLNTAVAVPPFASWTIVPGAALMAAGKDHPS